MYISGTYDVLPIPIISSSDCEGIFFTKWLSSVDRHIKNPIAQECKIIDGRSFSIICERWVPSGTIYRLYKFYGSFARDQGTTMSEPREWGVEAAVVIPHRIEVR